MRCRVKGREAVCKVKTATTFVKSTTMIDKTKAMIDKSKAVTMIFRDERAVYGRCKDVTNVKFIEKR